MLKIIVGYLLPDQNTHRSQIVMAHNPKMAIELFEKSGVEHSKILYSRFQSDIIAENELFYSVYPDETDYHLDFC